MVTIADHLGHQDRSGPLFLNSGSANHAYGARGPTQICKARRNIVLDPSPRDLRCVSRVCCVSCTFVRTCHGKRRVGKGIMTWTGS